MGCNAATITAFMAYPYGNAQEKQNADATWTFTCQHGNSECIGNMYEGCAIEHYPTVTQGVPAWWPFFLCLEASGNAGTASVAQNCAKNNNIDWNVIDACSGSNPAQGTAADGNPHMHSIAVATNSLVPPHQWTPWVVINGSPLNQAQLDASLIKLVCQAYTGTPPSCCSAFNWEVDYANATAVEQN